MIEAVTSTFLICTVGGTPEPVVTALEHWNPLKVRFVPTPETRRQIEEAILPQARERGLRLDPGRYEILVLPDPEDLALCLDSLRQLTVDVEAWVRRGDGFQVVVDFTGGTKCMTAAIALQASRWPCLFSYVGGASRTKEGVGIVISGAEKVLYQENPWDALGHQAVVSFVILFDQLAFAAAASAVSKVKTLVSRPDRKRELNALEQLAKAFDAWDRFEHSKSISAFRNVENAANDLRAVLGPITADRVLAGVARYKSHLDAIRAASPPSRHHVVDLLANAQRRRFAGRIDDAVARIYRGIEALAQLELQERHGIESTERVPLDSIPEALRSQWSPRSKEGVVALGLQDSYALLESFESPLAKRFTAAGLNGTQSPLTARNRSILAHGFAPVSESVFESLWNAALTLANTGDADLPIFATIGTGSGYK